MPLNALLATTAIGGACFLTSLLGDGVAYVWLVNSSGLAGFITWMGVAWCHYRFRRAYLAQGRDLADLPFRARWFPLGPIVALAMCAVVVAGQNYQAFMGHLDVRGLMASYIGLPSSWRSGRATSSSPVLPAWSWRPRTCPAPEGFAAAGAPRRRPGSDHVRHDDGGRAPVGRWAVPTQRIQ